MKLSVAVWLLSVASTAYAEKFNLKKSKITWEGRTLIRNHSGWVYFIKAEIKGVEKEKPFLGRFVADMESLTVDRKNVGFGAKKLLRHLKSVDFFDVQKYPTASFELHTVNESKASGLLTIKDTTKKVSFDFARQRDHYYAILKIDRTDFGIVYGSRKSLKRYGDSFIEDEIVLKIELYLDRNHSPLRVPIVE